MTRFMMTLNDAVDLVIYAFEHGENGDLFRSESTRHAFEHGENGDLFRSESTRRYT